MSFQTLIYERNDRVARITFNRPERLNTIVPPMPDELQEAVEEAVADEQVRVIVLRGAGRAFCAGFDFGDGFHHWDEMLTTDGAGTRARTSSEPPPPASARCRSS